MDLQNPDAATRERLAALCRAHGLDPSYGAFVARHVDANDDSWRWCCGSNCDPCVQQLGRAVDAARDLLRAGSGPPPLPGEAAGA